MQPLRAELCRPDLGAVIERLQAYEAAGADVLFAPGLQDLGAIREVCAAVGKPVNVVLEAQDTVTGVAQLAEAGVKRISVGATLARLAYGALIAAARDMTESGSFDFTKTAMDYAELEAFFTQPIQM